MEVEDNEGIKSYPLAPLLKKGEARKCCETPDLHLVIVSPPDGPSVWFHVECKSCKENGLRTSWSVDEAVVLWNRPKWWSELKDINQKLSNLGHQFQRLVRMMLNEDVKGVEVAFPEEDE